MGHPGVLEGLRDVQLGEFLRGYRAVVSVSTCCATHVLRTYHFIVMISLLVPQVEFFLRDVDGLRLLCPRASASVPKTGSDATARHGCAETTYFSVVSVVGGGQIAIALPLLLGFTPALFSFFGFGIAFCLGAAMAAGGVKGLGGTITGAALITAPPLSKTINFGTRWASQIC